MPPVIETGWGRITCPMSKRACIGESVLVGTRLLGIRDEQPRAASDWTKAARAAPGRPARAAGAELRWHDQRGRLAGHPALARQAARAEARAAAVRSLAIRGQRWYWRWGLARQRGRGRLSGNTGPVAVGLPFTEDFFESGAIAPKLWTAIASQVPDPAVAQWSVVADDTGKAAQLDSDGTERFPVGGNSAWTGIRKLELRVQVVSGSLRKSTSRSAFYAP